MPNIPTKIERPLSMQNLYDIAKLHNHFALQIISPMVHTSFTRTSHLIKASRYVFVSYLPIAVLHKTVSCPIRICLPSHPKLKYWIVSSIIRMHVHFGLTYTKIFQRRYIGLHDIARLYPRHKMVPWHVTSSAIRMALYWQLYELLPELSPYCWAGMVRGT